MIRGRLVGSVFGRWPVLNADHSRDSQASKTRPSRGASAAGSDGAPAQDLARSARSMTAREVEHEPATGSHRPFARGFFDAA